VLCNNKEPLDVALTGVGKIILNSGCKGYSSMAFLQTSGLVKVKYLNKEDIISRIQMDLDCLEEIGIRLNTYNSSIDLEFIYATSNVDDLNHVSYKISELEKVVDEQECKTTNQVNMTHIPQLYMCFLE
jgi:hypothetical protein